jgi:hypothetical protein
MAVISSGRSEVHAANALSAWRAERVRPERERGDDAEVAAAATQAPEQLRIVPLAGVDGPAIRGDEVGGDEVVGREPV